MQITRCRTWVLVSSLILANCRGSASQHGIAASQTLETERSKSPNSFPSLLNVNSIVDQLVNCDSFPLPRSHNTSLMLQFKAAVFNATFRLALQSKPLSHSVSSQHAGAYGITTNVSHLQAPQTSVISSIFLRIRTSTDRPSVPITRSPARR